MLRPLYEIANEFTSLIQRMQEVDELTPEYIAELELVEGSVKDKALSVAAFIKNLEIEDKAMEEAIESITQRQKSVASKMNWLKGYLKENMERCEINEIKSPYFDIKLKQNPPSVNITDEKQIPDQYYIESIMRRLDKTTLSQDLKNGKTVPGVSLERKTRVEIK